MTWAPLVLAILFGLIVSAGIYFTMMWPDVAPLDDDDGDGAGDAGGRPDPDAGGDHGGPAHEPPPDDAT